MTKIINHIVSGNNFHGDYKVILRDLEAEALEAAHAKITQLREALDKVSI